VNKKPTLADLKVQVKELAEALSRERADSINLRRRTEEDRVKMADFYKAMVVRELLPTFDNLERALKHIPKDLKDHNYVNGVQGVAKQFEKALDNLGIEKIKSIGKEFDPKYHEAISMEDEGGDTEIVTDELQAGYKSGNEVIRHAMVKVKMEKKNG
jgi:molecular chaperone GrpE